MNHSDSPRGYGGGGAGEVSVGYESRGRKSGSAVGLSAATRSGGETDAVRWVGWWRRTERAEVIIVDRGGEKRMADGVLMGEIIGRIEGEIDRL